MTTIKITGNSKEAIDYLLSIEMFDNLWTQIDIDSIQIDDWTFAQDIMAELDYNGYEFYEI